MSLSLDQLLNSIGVLVGIAALLIPFHQANVKRANKMQKALRKLSRRVLTHETGCIQYRAEMGRRYDAINERLPSKTST